MRIFVCKLRLHLPDSKHLRGLVCHEIFGNFFRDSEIFGLHPPPPPPPPPPTIHVSYGPGGVFYRLCWAQLNINWIKLNFLANYFISHKTKAMTFSNFNHNMYADWENVDLHICMLWTNSKTSYSILDYNIARRWHEVGREDLGKRMYTSIKFHLGPSG
jgi:hypothetical protein